ncbi:tetratricopeptide repeat protein [Pseudanabaena galeata UHCC 0370]|uniref:Tetratricopeptide repeat protein n=1 Tax=Pseudanabaena galeata UHCC 0370 TaxID=3110310 RepID=A0ABU5TCK2_9CYAN|nr:tetratricopeptide repeat protein [Pseudanabaena galeata]MEA5476002.1 tetratricopeptide repeat protein [Pseudanabaena galeata UHCC 0370]
MMTNLTAAQELYAVLEIDLASAPLDRYEVYAAINYYLVLEDEPSEDVKNLEKVDRYLHVFRHLCEVSEWKKAGQVLSFRLEENGKELHEQLRIWGCYRNQIELYQELLGKVSPEQDLICLSGLGKAFDNLGDFSKSLNYYEKLLELARQVNNRQAEAQALNGLGNIQLPHQNYLKAIAFFQQQLEIAREIGDQEQEGYALICLGWASFRHDMVQGKKLALKSGLNYFEGSLKIARTIGNQDLIFRSLGYISEIYFDYSQVTQSVVFLQEQLDICEETSDQYQRHSVLSSLGQCYSVLKQYENALECLQESLKIVREIGDLYSEVLVLNKLSILYGYELQKYEVAVLYCEKGFEITQKLNLGLDNIIPDVINLFNFYTFLDQKDKSDLYLKMAESIASESDSVETKAMIVMALARAYWSREQIWYRLYGLFLAVKGLMMIPPWQSVNGRIALQLTITVLTKSAQDLQMSAFKNMKKLLGLETAKEVIVNDHQ